MFENLQVLLPVFFVWVRILYLHLSHIIVCLAAFRTVMFATSCRLARGYEATSRVYFHSVCEQAGNGAFALYYGGGLGHTWKWRNAFMRLAKYLVKVISHG